jgi:hypothetical protein
MGAIALPGRQTGPGFILEVNMTTVHVDASANIEASATELYHILADYAHAHPAILPKPYFERLEVKRGGQGAGTEFMLQMNVLGTRRMFHEVVTEPVPGRVLIETDSASGQRSTFTLEPLAPAGPTRVTIATDFPARPGLFGFFERWLNPVITRHIFLQELRLLAEYMAAKKVWDQAAQAEPAR